MGGPCPATPPSTDRTGEVLIALGKISRQPLTKPHVLISHGSVHDPNSGGVVSIKRKPDGFSAILSPLIL
jgi:hypothetical protein